MASVWVWRPSPDGFRRPYRVSGLPALPYRVAHRCIHVIRQAEKLLTAVAGNGADRLHVIEDPAPRPFRPRIVCAPDDIDKLRHRDDGAQCEVARHRPAGEPFTPGVSAGLLQARGMDREWPTI